MLSQNMQQAAAPQHLTDCHMIERLLSYCMTSAEITFVATWIIIDLKFKIRKATYFQMIRKATYFILSMGLII